MTMQGILFVILAAILVFVAVRALSKGGSGSANKGVPVLPEGKPLDLSEFYRLINEIQGFYETLAHPQDLLNAPQFQRAVKALDSQPLDNQALLEYAGGGNPLISCAACEALNRRGMEKKEIDGLIATIKNSAPWSMFYAFRAIHESTQSPVVGRVLAQVQPWWLENTFVPQVLHPFITDRVNAGEKMTFGKRLSGLDEESTKNLEAFLKQLNREELRPLLDELSSHAVSAIDHSFLNSFGRIWTAKDVSDPVFENPALALHVEKIKDTLLKAPNRSVLLVGERGVGKTSLIKRVVREIQKDRWEIFEARASDLLAGQIFIGQLEERLQLLVKNLQVRKKVIWVAPNFHELYYAGKSHYSPIGVLDRLVPEIENGDILLIGATTPAAFEQLNLQNRKYGMMMETVRVSPLDDRQTLDIALRWAKDEGVCQDGSFIVTEPIAREALHLAKQFLVDKEAPGNLMDLLKLTRRASLSVDNSPRPITTDDLYRTLSHLTGLPRSILDERVGLDLQALRELFQQRVLGQPEAVDCLVERVAMIKTGLTDSSRPSGVFLFAGPTGTGKTEIAKTLAEFLFGSPDRMIRLDMSEYQTPESLESILGERGEVQRTEAASSLFVQIRKQPFSVILLDEFEKAHPRIWDLFLQVFDDGRLTDRSGNTANFRNSIIILTSNLGAKIQAGESIGFGSSFHTFSAAGVEKAINETFRREFINRLDRVVIFRPLSRKVMREILQNELKNVLTRRGLRMREWAIEWEDSALEFLLDKGFTPDLGARPLKRAVERYLLSPLALTIIDHQVPKGDQFLFVRSDGQRIEVEFIDPDAPETEPEPTEKEVQEIVEGELDLKQIMLDARGTGAEAQVLKRHHTALTNTIQSPEWTERKDLSLSQTNLPGFWQSEERFAVLGEVEYMDRVETGLKTADSLLNRLVGQEKVSKKNFSVKLVSRLAQQLYLLEKACDAVVNASPKEAFLKLEAQAVHPVQDGTAMTFFRDLCGMYRQWAAKRRMRLEVLEESLSGPPPYLFLASVTGFGSFSILDAERGLHVLEVPKDDGRNFQRYTVRVSVIPQPDVPAQGAAGLLEQARRCFSEAKAMETKVARRYREKPSPLVRDQDGNWRTGRIDRVLGGDFDLFG